MMCSHMPDTTRPIANPEKPLTKPPVKAARTKRVRTNPSIGRSPKEGDAHLDGGDPSGGEAANPQARQTTGFARVPLFVTQWQGPRSPLPHFRNKGHANLPGHDWRAIRHDAGWIQRPSRWERRDVDRRP